MTSDVDEKNKATCKCSFFEVVLGGGIMILSFLCVYFMAVLVMM